MESRYIGYKIKLFPTPDQAKRLIQICNTFRYCYNWGLEFCNKAREEGRKHPTWIDMEKEFTTFRHENKWLENYPRTTCTNAFKNVSNAFERFFSKQCRYPKFKSKRKDRMRFHTREDRMRFIGVKSKNRCRIGTCFFILFHFSVICLIFCFHPLLCSEQH